MLAMATTFETIDDLETVSGGYNRMVADRMMRRWSDTGSRVGAGAGLVIGGGAGATTGFPAALYMVPWGAAKGAVGGHIVGRIVGGGAGWTYGALKTLGQ